MNNKCIWQPERSLFFDKHISLYRTECKGMFNGAAYEYHIDRYDCPEFKYCPYCGNEKEIEEA